MEKSEAFLTLQQNRLIPKGFAGYSYEREGTNRFRDCLIIYMDGRARFERYCYGEAAGIVFGVWIDSIGADGVLNYRQPFDSSVRQEVLPTAITHVTEDTILTIDPKPGSWKLKNKLKEDGKNGYSRLKMLFGGKSAPKK